MAHGRDAEHRPLGDVAPTAEDLGSDLDLVFVKVGRQGDLTALAALRACIAQAGAFWVHHPKGCTDLKDTDVMAAGRAVGLVDNKVARVSETLSALRFVIPKANRRPTAAGRQ